MLAVTSDRDTVLQVLESTSDLIADLVRSQDRPANMTAHAQMCEFCVSQVDGQTFLIAMTSSANVVEKEDMVEAFQDRHPRAADARPAPKPGRGVCWQAVARCGNKGTVA